MLDNFVQGDSKNGQPTSRKRRIKHAFAHVQQKMDQYLQSTCWFEPMFVLCWSSALTQIKLFT